MPLSNAEFQAILDDGTKTIEGNIAWSDDEDHSPSVEFRAEVRSDPGWPLFVRGSYNHLARTLSYALILKTQGRIYALDLGKEHHNPTCEMVGERHKHRWTAETRDKLAYVPSDVTAGADDPVAVWSQFLAEARIVHRGRMEPPSTATQKELWP